jgi:3-hydroxybutyryl-CoA dehydrogenase
METIGIVGAGTMGSGIAQGAALHGYRVRLHDRDGAAVRRAVAAIGDSLARAVAKGKMSRDAADAALQRVVPAERLSDLGDAGVVVEAIIEAPQAKSALFQALGQVVQGDAVVATNPSALKVDDLAEAMVRPARFLGLHYFFPAAVNPLVEVVRGAATSDKAMDKAFAFVRACGKQPIACRDQFGFAVNRFFVPYLNEAVRLADEGADPGAVDAAARAAFQTAAGPFRVMDLTKPAIALHSTRTLAQLGAFYAPAPGLVAIGESGRNWTPEPEAAPGPYAERLQAAVFLAVLQELSERVATPEDIDLGAKLGLQWGWQPCAAMRALGRGTVRAMVAPLAERHGAAVDFGVL